MAFVNTIEGYADGATITPGTSGGASGNAFGTVQGTWNARTATAFNGTVSARCTLSATTGSNYVRADDATSGRSVARFELWWPGNPSGTATVFSGRYFDGTTDLGVYGLQIQASGIPQMFRTNSGTVITTSRPGSSPFGAVGWYPIELAYTPGASSTTARLEYRVLNASETVLFEWAPGTDIDVGTTAATNRHRVGQATSTVWASPYFDIDTPRVESKASGWLGAYVPTNAPPTAGLTVLPTGTLEPGQSFTLTLTDADSDGTVVARSLTQTAGTTVTLSGSGGSGSTRTGEAPYTLAGDTVTFQYVTTDDDGATSVAAAVSIPVLRATERIVVTGGPSPVEVPARLSAV